MFPEICTIGPFTLYSFGLMLVLAFLVSASLASIEAKREKIDPDVIFNVCFVGFIFGVLGSRIFYVIANFKFYLNNPLEIFMLNHGGMAWFGGLILGSFASVIYIKKKKLSLLKILDLIAPFIALAQAIGRIGCLLNGCCYGKVGFGFGIYFKVHDAVLIPTQLYSSLALLLIYFILRFLQNKPHKTGLIFFVYLLLYSVKRFSIEFLRDDNARIISGLTLFQLLSIAVFCIAIAGIIIKWKNTR
ncbi:MAG: prolipoprotein diacylglyceryl transferase [Candidatus Omnitrophica bacterium]|nr:prolipoprotein diacylglyceryl transferase [Candidatus Omnitrophota bacterium]